MSPPGLAGSLTSFRAIEAAAIAPFDPGHKAAAEGWKRSRMIQSGYKEARGVILT